MKVGSCEFCKEIAKKHAIFIGLRSEVFQHNFLSLED